MDAFTMITSLGICLVLPVIIVGLTFKHKLDSEKNKKEIIMQALEKDADVDIDSLVKKLNGPDKLIKEKLLEKFNSGVMMAFLGSGMLIADIAMCFMGGVSDKKIYGLLIGGVVVLGIGVANLLSYYMGKKMLAKEMEAEEKNMQEK